MTPWDEDWRALVGYIEGLTRAGQLYLEAGGEDAYGIVKRILLPQTAQVYEQIEAFRAAYEPHLPRPATECLDRFCKVSAIFFQTPQETVKGLLLGILKLRLVALVSVRSELDFHLANKAVQVRASTDRALLHLQRLIIVDPDYREKWRNAFERDEESCERLGAVHLLWHGIWAFKAHASGARTDLVLGTRIDSRAEVRSAVVGLVHTEWKRARETSEIEMLFAQARDQAKRYAEGVLAGIELVRPTYLIVVTADSEPVPESDDEFCFVNLAVDPSTPSETARRIAKRR